MSYREWSVRRRSQTSASSICRVNRDLFPPCNGRFAPRCDGMSPPAPATDMAGGATPRASIDLQLGRREKKRELTIALTSTTLLGTDGQRKIETCREIQSIYRSQVVSVFVSRIKKLFCKVKKIEASTDLVVYIAFEILSFPPLVHH